ncbi:Armadillo-type fold [Phytophthora cinnamomi]|uniref:Armadillo-type fold n=1 Tax=Phytophthora cinnamomi TaxID=4785 RepID=UPI0035599ECB|nr:Armadillo-type fold [Phytophthora cinnamomi]
MQRLELLRASATDADAVRQYLQSIDADELDALLDGIAPRDAKCAASKGKARAKDQTAFLVQDDWLPLVQLLAQCDATRLRAACRIVQELRRGSPSELESMQLLTEVTLGYARALDELQERRDSSRGGSRRRLLLDEIRVLLDVVFSFLAEVVEAAKPTKVLPQLLGLVPYFLGLMGEITGEEADAGVQENLAKLLELPWSCQTVPSLLDVLVDDAALMSRESWQQLQENVERMVTTSPEMTSETMNPVIRECVLVANVTGDHKWISIARYLLRQLPVHLRQEAEFNLLMSFQQSPRIVSLVCESIRSSTISESAGVDMTAATSLFDSASFSELEQNDTGDHSPSKFATALLLLQAIFETASETRSEVLSCLFERSQNPTQRKIAGETLSQLFISQSGKLFPHINAVQDWLSMQFQRSFDSAHAFFLIASRLATVHKDLYNFLMTIDYRLVSSKKKKLYLPLKTV